jgi:heterodisulfide reductase subunit C
MREVRPVEDAGVEGSLGEEPIPALGVRRRAAMSVSLEGLAREAGEPVPDIPAPAPRGSKLKRKRGRPAADRSRFDARLDPTFTSELISLVPDGQRLMGCIQCGTCSGSCPLSMYMDLTPRRLIEMTRSGARDEVLGSYAIWVCASCYACQVECPKQIPITEIVHGLRRMAFEQGSYPRRFPNPVMTRELVTMAQERGRSTESWIATRSYLRTDPRQLLKHATLGMRLMLRGRMGLRRDAVRDRRGFKELLRAVKAGQP